MATVFHTTLKLLEWIFFGILVVCFLIIVSPLLPTRHYLASYAVITGSMEPNVPVGALAFVSEVSPQDLKQGEVIAFPNPDNPKVIILHRIAEVKPNGQTVEFKTKGDNNDSTDQWTVLGSQVRGRMVTSIPYLGVPIKFAQTVRGFAILVGIPAGILIALQIKTIREGINEEVDRRTNSALKKQQTSSIET